MQQVVFEGFGGVTLAADVLGSEDGPPVLLIPPSSQTREFWRAAAKALAQAGRRAICLDLRGHGGSGHSSDGRYDLDLHVADIKSVLASLTMRAYVLAAGSGAVAALVAIGESDSALVAGATLVDAHVTFENDVIADLHEKFRKRTSQIWMRDELVEMLSTTFPDEPRPTAMSQLLAAFEQLPGGQLRWRGDPRVTAEPALYDLARLETAARKVIVPVQLIRGSLNQTIPARAVEHLQRLLGNAAICEIEGMGHYAGADRDDVFNATVLEFIEQHAPRAPLSYAGGSEPRILRDALGCFGTGVTVITTTDPGGTPIGLTANSFTSVSLDPPLILFSLGKNSYNLESFIAAGRFAVNVLHIGQQPVAAQFTRRDGDRYAGIDWSYRTAGGSPIISSSLASFDCTTYAIYEGGDHMVFIGEVKEAWFEPARDPLLYFRGKYRRLHFA